MAQRELLWVKKSVKNLAILALFGHPTFEYIHHSSNQFMSVTYMKFYNVLPFYEIRHEDAALLREALGHRPFRYFQTIRFHEFLGGWTVYLMLWNGGSDKERYYIQKLWIL